MSPLPRRINPDPCQRMSHHGIDRLRAFEALDRCPGAEKDASGGSWRPPGPQVVGDGLADIRRKRELGITATLSAHRDQPGLPVQILQSECRDLTRTQT